MALWLIHSEERENSSQIRSPFNYRGFPFHVPIFRGLLFAVPLSLLIWAGIGMFVAVIVQ